MNYFLYARKSTDVEDKQVLSIEGQLAELRSLARNEGLEVVAEFVEKRTAKMPGRPVFNEMLKRIQQDEAQGHYLLEVRQISSQSGRWRTDQLATPTRNNQTYSNARPQSSLKRQCSDDVCRVRHGQSIYPRP